MYTDADFANNTSQKSQSDYVVKFGKFPVMWFSKKQSTVVCLTAEAEIAAITIRVTDAIWLQTMLYELSNSLTITGLGDNKPSIQIMNNQNSSQRSIHMDIKVSFLRNLVTRKKITV